MSYQCEIREQAQKPVLSIRLNTPVQKLPQAMGQVYGRIAQYLNALGEHPQGAPFAIYYNMDMANLDVGIGFPTAKPLPGKDDIHSGAIGGGKVTTFFRLLWIIPIAIILGLISGVGETVTYTITLNEAGQVVDRMREVAGGLAGSLSIATALMIIFRRRYPVGGLTLPVS